MRIKELTNAPKWLTDAIVRDEDVTIDEYGRVQWHSGDFLGGDFWGEDFLGGNFLGGNFLGGNFRCGNFWGGNFLGGNFRGGNFLGGDFRGGEFWGEKINIKPLCLYGLTWRVIITDSQMQIGCQRHTHEAWFAFTDSEISSMEHRAAEFWAEHRVALLEMCAAHAHRAAAADDRHNEQA